MRSILWRRLDQPGHEYARLCREPSQYTLAGTTLFAENHLPCRLDYQVVCNAQWQTVSAQVTGWVGHKVVLVELAATPDHRWLFNKKEAPQVAGCIDVDLNFSPATNLLPIRRVHLAEGEEVVVSVAWVHFPSFTLEKVTQRYRRIDARTYHFEITDGSFTTTLQVGAEGFIECYPDLWQVDAAS